MMVKYKTVINVTSNKKQEVTNHKALLKINGSNLLKAVRIYKHPRFREHKK